MQNFIAHGKYKKRFLITDRRCTKGFIYKIAEKNSLMFST